MLQIRTMTTADVLLGMRLKEQNGWNQLEMDWHRLLALEPEGCFVAEWNGKPVGTTCTTVFDSTAWISMVLVDASERGKGIGSALMRRALDYLADRDVRSVRLDATPAGRPIYEKLGFVAEYRLARYEGILPEGSAADAIEAIEAIDLHQTEHVDRLVAWDRVLCGTNRLKFLAQLFGEWPEVVRIVQRDNEIQGYLTVRPGSQALQIGPCLATPLAGPALFLDAAQRFAGRYVCIDIPTDNVPARAVAETMGLRVQRHLLRMGRGEPVREDIAHLWASSGPEKG
jgi:GNAT superfamily N-acetyltransferase